MTDPINGVSRGSIPLSHGPGKAKDAVNNSAADKAGQSGGSQDVVNLTSTAETLKQLEKSLASEAEVSLERVAAVKQALTSGDYKIDPDLIAKKFLEVERALGKV